MKEKKYIKIAKIAEKSKYLVIGESHYFNYQHDNIDENELITDWYSLTNEKFIKKYGIDEDHAKWFDTQSIFKNNYENYKKGKSVERSKRILWIVARAICEAEGVKNINKESISSKMRLYHFMNYFLRPAIRSGKQINSSQEDLHFAQKNFEDILVENRYESIFVLSKKVENSIKTYLSSEEIKNNNIYFFTHPASIKGWGYNNPEGYYQKLVFLLKNSIKTVKPE